MALPSTPHGTTRHDAVSCKRLAASVRQCITLPGTVRSMFVTHLPTNTTSTTYDPVLASCSDLHLLCLDRPVAPRFLDAGVLQVSV